jgi:hypothetical protein
VVVAAFADRKLKILAFAFVFLGRQTTKNRARVHVEGSFIDRKCNDDRHQKTILLLIEKLNLSSSGAQTAVQSFARHNIMRCHQDDAILSNSIQRNALCFPFGARSADVQKYKLHHYPLTPLTPPTLFSSSPVILPLIFCHVLEKPPSCQTTRGLAA